MVQGHVSGFDLMFTVLIPGDEWASNRLFIVIPFEASAFLALRVMIVISYLTLMQMLMLLHARCKKADRNGDDIQSMTYRSENQFDNK
jgi:hypothetical protein